MTHATPEFAYLRQTARENEAAVVSEGAVKPTSTYSVERVEDKLDVIAHLSEGVPRFWLIDSAGLESFLTNELEYGLQVAIEAKVIADVNGTSGVQTVDYSTSVLQTLRKTITKLEVTGYNPAGSCCTRTIGRVWNWPCRAPPLSSISRCHMTRLPAGGGVCRL